ncbi:MAG: hypothetical protein E7122_04550 [Bacteroidales bacterium]|nr:hypothetical protein [Bacteroidales bacterium]
MNRTLLLFVMAVLAAVGCNQAGRKDSEALRKSLDIADRMSTGCYIVPLVLKCGNVPDTVDTSCIVVTNAGYFRDRYMRDKVEPYYPSNYNQMSEYAQIKWWKEIEYKYYRLLVDNNMILEVDSLLYAEYYPDRTIVDHEIATLYRNGGIASVLNKYLDEDGWLEKYVPWDKYITRDTVVMEKGYDGKMEERHMKIRTGEINHRYTYHGQGVNVDYIMYLASLHNIYFFLYYHLPDEYCGYYISQWDDGAQLQGVHYIEERANRK